MRALQLAIRPEDRRDHRWIVTDEAIAVFAFAVVLDEVGTAGMAEQRGRSRGKTPTGQARFDYRRADRLRQRPVDCFSTALIRFFRWRRCGDRRAFCANYP